MSMTSSLLSKPATVRWGMEADHGIRFANR
jgi:hypothetical protein